MPLELLAGLAAYAVSNKSSTAKVHLSKLPVEEARKKVNIKNGNRKPVADGSQALTLVLGRHVLPLDIIANGSTRVVTPKDKVEQFSEILQKAVDAGDFDVQIVAAQKLSIPKPRKAKPDEVPVNENIEVELTEDGIYGIDTTIAAQEPELEVASADDIDGLDFSGIEGLDN